MTNKTMELYSLTMQHIMKELQRADPGEAAVRIVVSDYDNAMMSTMENVFPRANVRGSWMEIGQVRKCCNFIRLFKKILSSSSFLNANIIFERL